MNSITGLLKSIFISAFKLLNFCCKYGNNLKKVSYDTYISNIKDWSIFIFVDSYDIVSTCDTCNVLCSTWDTASDVKLGSNALAWLTDLVSSWNPASFDRCSCCTDNAAKCISKLFKDCKVFSRTNTTSAGNDYVSLFKVYCFRNFFYNVNNLSSDCICSTCDRLSNDFSCLCFIGFSLLESTWTMNSKFNVAFADCIVKDSTCIYRWCVNDLSVINCNACYVSNTDWT